MGTDTTEKTHPGKVNHSARDDEVEFVRIPIAGDDSEDYSSDSEIKGVAGILAKIVMVKVKPSLLAQGSFYAGKEFP